MAITSRHFSGRKAWSDAKDFVNSLNCKRVYEIEILYEE